MTDPMLVDAERVAKGLTRPSFSKRQYEDAMLDLAKREARSGESTAASFARLCTEGDARINALYKASVDSAPEPLPPPANKVAPRRHGSREHVWELIQSHARLAKRADESVEQATTRLLKTNPVVRDAYALYSELGG